MHGDIPTDAKMDESFLIDTFAPFEYKRGLKHGNMHMGNLDYLGS